MLIITRTALPLLATLVAIGYAQAAPSESLRLKKKPVTRVLNKLGFAKAETPDGTARYREITRGVVFTLRGDGARG